MPRYEEDADSGDISLSLPLSRSSPQLSSILNDNHAGPSRYREVHSPTPKRLLGKTLWPRTNGDSHVENRTAASSPGIDERRSQSANPFGGDVSTTTIPMTRRTSSSTTIKPVSRSRSMNVRHLELSLDRRKGSNGSNGAHTPSTRLGWSRRPGEPRPPPLVNQDTVARMERWIKEIVVCNFDLERGPVVERKVMGRPWGPGEKENVAFSSFPDTSLFAEGDIQFSFKIRHIPPNPLYPEPPSPMPPGMESTESALLNTHVEGSNGDKKSLDSENKAEEYRKWNERGREWVYGFVWFEQRRDGGIARGYMQKSLVILTHLPFPAFFAAVLDRIAPVFFEHGYSALEAACHAIASWPDPWPDVTLGLPLLSEVVHVKLPDSNESPQLAVSAPTYNMPRPIFASLPPCSPLKALSTILPSLWSIWECLLLAEPVLVIAPDPKTCSEIVWWLRDLLRPIPPAGDFRPYLHIHDHDFSLLVNSNKPQPGLVVGVTNPFFRNAASHWPNVISIPSTKHRRPVNGSSSAIKVEQPEGFISKRHRSVQKERTLLKRLETLAAEGNLDDVAANDALRTHFQQLTEQMLVPLNRYFQTLVPTLSPNPSPTLPPQSNNTLKAFSIPSFLTHLKTRGPNPLLFRSRGLTSRARVESDFYTAFCMSPTFAGWLAARVNSLGLAVAQQSTSLLVPGDSRRPSAAGLGLTPILADLALSDSTTSGTRSPTQWSSEGDPRMSSDGSSVGQYSHADEPIRRR